MQNVNNAVSKYFPIYTDLESYSIDLAKCLNLSGSFLSQGMNKSANSDDKGRLETVLRGQQFMLSIMHCSGSYVCGLSEKTLFFLHLDLGQDMKMVYLKWSQPFA